MYPRTNYEMTEAELKELLDACKPVVCMRVGGVSHSSPQENANRAWDNLGKKMGFDYMTVQPISGKGERFFSAIPLENEDQRTERLKREAEEKRLVEIKNIQDEISEKKQRLVELRKPICLGIQLDNEDYSGCTGLGGDCPECGK